MKKKTLFTACLIALVILIVEKLQMETVGLSFGIGALLVVFGIIGYIVCKDDNA